MQIKDPQERMPRTATPCTNTNGPHAPTPAHFQDAYKVHLVTRHSFHTLAASGLARWARMHAGKRKAVTFEGMQVSSAERREDGRAARRRGAAGAPPMHQRTVLSR